MQRLLISQPWFTDCEGSTRATGHKAQMNIEYSMQPSETPRSAVRCAIHQIQQVGQILQKHFASLDCVG